MKSHLLLPIAVAFSAVLFWPADTIDRHFSDPSFAENPPNLAAQATCCSRTIMMDFSGPDGQDTDLARLAHTLWGTQMIRRQGTGEPLGFMRNECPLRLTLVNKSEADAEYAFRGVLTEDVASKECAFDLKLIDRARGATIKRYNIKWPIPPDFIIGGRQSAMDAPLAQLALQFKHINEMLHDYEGMPETATVKPERETMTAGKTYAVQLSGILDSRGRPAKSFQYVLVKPEKGKIVEGANGVRQDNDTWRFPVGAGSIVFKYRAPEECKDQTDLITVWNSCNTNPARTPNLPLDKEREIGRAEVKIRCYQGDLDFKFHYEVTCTHPMGAWSHGTIKGAAKFPFAIDFDHEPPRWDGNGTYDGTVSIISGPVNFPLSSASKTLFRAMGIVETPKSGPWNLVITQLDDMAGHKIDMRVALPLVDGESRAIPTPMKEAVHMYPVCTLDKEESTVTVRLKTPSGNK